MWNGDGFNNIQSPRSIFILRKKVIGKKKSINYEVNESQTKIIFLTLLYLIYLFTYN